MSYALSEKTPEQIVADIMREKGIQQPKPEKKTRIADIINLSDFLPNAPKDVNPANVEITQEFEHCDKHGRFHVNVLGYDGHWRWMASGCPACAKEAATANLMRGKLDKLARCDIPPRFAKCSFDNYQVTTDAQRRALQVCRDYADRFPDMLENGTNLIMHGNAGTGKNHLATAIAKVALEQGYSVLRVKAQQYLDAYWAKAFDERESWVQQLARVDLLILDEVGRASKSDSANNAFFRLIDDRSEWVKPTLVLSNLNRDGLVEFLGSAAYDRLTMGGSQRIVFNWDSYRRFV